MDKTIVIKGDELDLNGLIMVTNDALNHHQIGCLGSSRIVKG